MKTDLLAQVCKLKNYLISSGDAMLSTFREGEEKLKILTSGAKEDGSFSIMNIDHIVILTLVMHNSIHTVTNNSNAT